MPGSHASVLEAIGNTPIVELNRYGAEAEPLLLAKLEFTNPGGSMKDRAALGMIEWAEREYGPRRAQRSLSPPRVTSVLAWP